MTGGGSLRQHEIRQQSPQMVDKDYMCQSNIEPADFTFGITCTQNH